MQIRALILSPTQTKPNQAMASLGLVVGEGVRNVLPLGSNTTYMYCENLSCVCMAFRVTFSPSDFDSFIIWEYFYRWKVLDFALLKNSSVSFFNDHKQEEAVAKWARAKTRAAMVILVLCMR